MVWCEGKLELESYANKNYEIYKTELLVRPFVSIKPAD